MRKYHPDLHAGNPQKHKTATQLTMSLTQAYNELELHLAGGPTERLSATRVRALSAPGRISSAEARMRSPAKVSTLVAPVDEQQARRAGAGVLEDAHAVAVLARAELADADGRGLGARGLAVGAAGVLQALGRVAVEAAVVAGAGASSSGSALPALA